MNYIKIYFNKNFNFSNNNTKENLLKEIGLLKIECKLNKTNFIFENEKQAEILVKRVVEKKDINSISLAIDAVISYQKNSVLRKYLAYIYFIKNEYLNCLALATSSFSINDKDYANLVLIGASLNAINNKELAEKFYAYGIEKWPENEEILNNAGKNYNEIGLYDVAAICLSKALKIKPNYYAAHNNFANSLIKLGDKNGALHHYKKSLIIQKTQEAYLNIGNIYKKEGDITEALDNYRKAESFDNKSAILYNNIAGLYKDIGRWDQANEYYKLAIELDPSDLTLTSNYLFTRAIYMPQGQEYYSEAKKFATRFEINSSKNIIINDIRKQKIKVRVGFISGDFWSHPVSYFLESFLPYLNRNEIDLIAFSTVIYTDSITNILRPHFINWHSLVGMSDQKAAELIRKNEIDLLIDLSGHTAENRLGIFKYRPARFSATWLGFPMTTGLTCIDYFIGDSTISPLAKQSNFTEKIINLDSVFCCFKQPTPTDESIPIFPNERNEKFTYGSFNKLSKITDKTIELWSKILKSDVHTRLYLNSPIYKDSAILRSVSDRFIRQGVFLNQLIFDSFPAGRRDLVLKGYSNIDVVLDTNPYPGGTTSVEAIWMGRPVVTLLGDTAISRIGASINKACGYDDLIATNEDEFVNKALQIRENFHLNSKSTDFRKILLKTPLFDGTLFAESFIKMVNSIVKNKIDISN
jgi:protein O-GlcNAc transferase